MEKYAVVTEDPKKGKPGEKRATVRNDQDKRESNVPISDKHGTRPFEPKETPKDQ